MMLTVGSLFSGIGGLDLGLERAGMEVRWQCEIDPFRRKVLSKHWRGVPCYEDVREIDGSAEKVDLICGGFPCQPVSVAGRRQAQADPRWLWPEFARVIGLLRPRYVLVENVPGLLVRGLGFVLADLSTLGYDAEWDCISAADVGAPHLRNRVWLIAHSVGKELRSQPFSFFGECRATVSRDDGKDGTVADTPSTRRYRREGQEQPVRGPSLPATRSGGRSEVVADAGGTRLALGQRKADRRRTVWGQGQTPTPRSWWATEPNVDRVAHGVPSRVERVSALGDAVVPQVAEYVGGLIVRASEASH